MVNKRWTYEEEELCKEMLRCGKSYEEIAKKVGRTVESIKNKNWKFWKVNKKIIHDIDFATEVFLKNGLVLEEGQVYINIATPMTGIAKESYKAYQSVANVRNGHPPLLFGLSNPHTIHNIRVWLSIYEPLYKLISDRFEGTDEYLDWIDDKGNPFKQTWTRFQWGYRNPNTTVERRAETRRRMPHEVRKEYEELLADGWSLIESEEYKYVNTQVPLMVESDEGYKAMVTLLNIQQNDNRSPLLFNIYYPEISTYNMHLWLRLNPNFKFGSNYKLKDDEIYRGMDARYKFICEIHDEFTAIWDNVRNGHGCKECYLENNRGENNVNYNPNKTDEERERGRHIQGYDKWRIAVYDRDRYTCILCGDSRGGNLNAHHLDGYDWCKEKRIDVDNGVTLCESCHFDFHDIYGYGANTRHQFEEFYKEERPKRKSWLC
ncbi:HNH endonuclease [Cytobacillus firmus]|uniref:HNH endonuclease n=1 Tax=Cytobacillus firmus TaxID=1399 RepID=UPI00203B5AFE|nr:HNH endonuclease signature motif containing protein [Cytobacillus firmus]MCM3706431.1 HNH endonuclease [Cytobacillus firmus]